MNTPASPDTFNYNNKIDLSIAERYALYNSKSGFGFMNQMYKSSPEAF